MADFSFLSKDLGREDNVEVGQLRSGALQWHPNRFNFPNPEVHKNLGLSMSEEALVDHIFVRLEPQVLDYVEVRNPKTTAQLLEIMAKFEEQYSCKEMKSSRSSDNVRRQGWDQRRMSNDESRRINWRDTEVIHRSSDRRNNSRGNYKNGPQWSQRNRRFDNVNRVNTDNRRFKANSRGYQSGNRVSEREF
ncbi:uncharacterized protein TNCV_1009681 [Trichonephila clavipes]|nr:uncharacterized protein TNCV_1009681 [Trichonephila clavipes]